MTYTIDTVLKTITIEGEIRIDVFLSEIERIPDYKNYKIISRSNFITVPYLYPQYPSYPYIIIGGENGAGQNGVGGSGGGACSILDKN